MAWCIMQNKDIFPKDSWESLRQHEIKPVKLKQNQLWIFTVRTDADAQYSGHLMQRTDYLEKTDAGKD